MLPRAVAKWEAERAAAEAARMTPKELFDAIFELGAKDQHRKLAYQSALINALRVDPFFAVFERVKAGLEAEKGCRISDLEAMRICHAKALAKERKVPFEQVLELLKDNDPRDPAIVRFKQQSKTLANQLAIYRKQRRVPK